MAQVALFTGNALAILPTLPAESIQVCVTSPPYWGLRDYGHGEQLGLEKTPEEYTARLVEVFREVRRVLRPDGTLWLNLGDCFAGTRGGGQGKDSAFVTLEVCRNGQREKNEARAAPGLKPKDLVGIPWRVAFALQTDGWWLRSDIIWHKPNPMPENIRDRPTKAHEYLFLLTKSERYFYAADAIAEPAIHAGRILDYTADQKKDAADPDRQRTLPRGRKIVVKDTRNRRSVWTIAAKPFRGAHFAVMPPDLVEPCVLVGSHGGNGAAPQTILDPFSGAGTVALVAAKAGRRCIGIELNPAYNEIARARLEAAGLSVKVIGATAPPRQEVDISAPGA